MPSQPWDSEDPDIKRNVIAGVKAARDGVTTSYLHEQWMRDKAHGWRYGPEKDAQAKVTAAEWRVPVLRELIALAARITS